MADKKRGCKAQKVVYSQEPEKYIAELEMKRRREEEAEAKAKEPPPPEKTKVPPKSGMSDRGLQRCRRLYISKVGIDEEKRVKLTVYTPVPDERIIETLTVRTPQDFQRVKMSFMAKYRIPPENIVDQR